MDSHPDRDDDLADVVDELEENVTGEPAQDRAPDSSPAQADTPADEIAQEPPD